MYRTVHAHLCLPQETARRLDRLRRGSHQPLARFITTILADYLDGTRTARPPRPSHPTRRRAA
jgi:hypothetical protein